MNRSLIPAAGRLPAVFRQAGNRAVAWALADPAQARALKRVACFFGAMLVLTLVARGTSGATMPQVKTVHPGTDTITQEIRLTGTVTPQGGIQLTAPEGLLVRQVLVEAGNTVAAGDPVAVLDAEDVDNQLAAQKAQITGLQGQLTGLTAQQPVDGSAVETAQLALATAQENYDAADKSDADTERRMRQALAEAQLAYNQAVRSCQQAADAAGTAAKQNAAAAAGIKLQIATAQARVKALEAVRDADYQLLADGAGTIQSLALAAGSTTAKIAATLWDADSGLQFAGTLPQADAEKLAVGMQVNLSQGSKSVCAALAAVSAPDAQGNVTLSAELAAGSLKNGAVSAAVVLSQDQYEQTVPLAAVHTDGHGDFVYSVEQHDTVLGLQNVLVRTQITVLMTGETKAAISSPLSGSDNVVVSSTKPLAPGCRVRLTA